MASKYLATYTSKLKARMDKQSGVLKEKESTKCDQTGVQSNVLFNKFSYSKTTLKLMPDKTKSGSVGNVEEKGLQMDHNVKNTDKNVRKRSHSKSIGNEQNYTTRREEQTNTAKDTLKDESNMPKDMLEDKSKTVKDILEDESNTVNDTLENNKLCNISKEAVNKPVLPQAHSSKGQDTEITCKNPIGKVFKFNVSTEVLEYVRNLDIRFKDQTQKSPTLYELKFLSANALEMLLRFNDRPIFKDHTKEDLVKMVFDYMKIGCPPRCPKCKRGGLRFSNGKKRYGKRYFWCPGSTTDGTHFYGCNFKADREEITRIPWKTPGLL